MKSKMVIFDLDGVLLDACDWHKDALNESLYEVSKIKINQEDHIKIFNGIPTRVKLQKLTEMGLINKDDHNKIYNLKQDKTIDFINKNARIDRDKIKLITELKNQGFYTCCYTNSIKKTANLMLKKIGVFELLDYVLTNQDVINPKPDPEGYLFLINKFNVAKKNCFIVEDSPKGIESAKRSGANVIVVKNSTKVNFEILKELNL